MLEIVSSAYSGLKSALDIAGGFLALKTETEKNTAIIGIQRHVLEAQRALMEADALHNEDLKRIAELEREIARMRDWSVDMQRYELKKFYPGTVAYVLRADQAAGEPIHSLCKHCYDGGKKSVLQASARSELRFRVFSCPACHNEIHMGGTMPDDADQRFAN